MNPPGYGAFWGEVQTNVHKALGCLGAVTNGSIRDLAGIAEGFQMLAGSIAPSHAYVHVVEFGISVTIHSMQVRSGDLIHATGTAPLLYRSKASTQWRRPLTVS